MKIETVKISSLKPYENNAKRHPQNQIEQIKQSIKEFGFNDPVGIDENNMIIEGHGRLEAAQQLGMKEIPCIRIEGLNEQQKKAYILAHNKLTMNTGFDMEKLQKEIEAIKTVDLTIYDFQIFSPEEVEEISVPTEEQVCTIVLNLTEDQYQTIMTASERIDEMVKDFHSYGNPNKRSNLINEIIYQWAAKRGVI